MQSLQTSDQQDIVATQRNNLLQRYSCYSSFYTYQNAINISIYLTYKYIYKISLNKST